MRFAALLSVVLCLTFGTAVLAADAPAAGNPGEAFVSHVVDQGMGIIKAKKAGQMTEDQARDKFREILNNSFDIPTIAKFTLGKYWRVATPAQQQEYTGLVKTKILDKYADRILSYSGNGFKLNGSRQINATDTAVSTLIDRNGDAPADFGWRLRKVGGGFKVIDISVEGISMSVTHRSDFASVIERNGGQVQSLIDALKSKEGISSDDK